MAPRTPPRSTRPAAAGRSREASSPIRASYGADEGYRQMQVEAGRQEARKEARAQRANEPRRFWMKPGETRELVIVDERMSFFRYEHSLKNPATGRFDLYTPCINEHANCPVCKTDSKPSYFAAYLTVIDLTPYEKEDGTVIEWSKRLLVIKQAQQKKFVRIQEREGNLRGVIIAATRDRDTDANIGNDFEVVEVMPEDDLLAYETVYEDSQGKEHDVIGHEAYNYDEVFPDWTEKQLATVAGGGTSPGNREETDRSIGRGRSAARRGRDEEEEERPAPRRASRREEPEDEEEEERPAARRSASRTPARRGRDEESEERTPARRAARRPVEETEDEEEEQGPPFEVDEDEEEERPAGRRAAPRSSSRETPSRDQGGASRSARRSEIRGRR